MPEMLELFYEIGCIVLATVSVIAAIVFKFKWKCSEAVIEALMRHMARNKLSFPEREEFRRDFFDYFGE